MQNHQGGKKIHVWPADAGKVEEGRGISGDGACNPSSEPHHQDADCTLTYIHQHLVKGKKPSGEKPVHEEVGQRIMSKTVLGGKGKKETYIHE